MRRLPTAPVAAGSLIGGFVLARWTRKRPLGAVPLVVGGGWCLSRWQRHGWGIAGALLGVYLASFVGSHPLAKRIGAWPSVLAVAAGSASASFVLADRRSVSKAT